MRRVFVPGFLAFLVLPLATSVLFAQDASFLTPTRGYYQPGTLPDIPGVGMQPGGPPMMIPPTPPPGYTPTPRGDLPSPLDRLPNIPNVQLTEAGGRAARTANENFDGDFGGVYYTQRITTGFITVPRVIGFSQRVVGATPVTTSTTTTVTTSTTTPGVPGINGARGVTVTNNTTNTVTNTVTNVPIIVNDPIVVNDVVAQQRIIRQVLAARYSGILITDNDGPRPQDRIYGGYNFYDNIGSSLNPGMGQTSLQRQTIGFEKTFLDGDASFGMRLPFVQQYGPIAANNVNTVGDLTLVWKFALYNDRETGDLWSTGMLLTTPTGGGNAILADGRFAPHSVIFQPWTGFVRTFDRAYVQGITSLLVPTDRRDPTLWNNDLAFGYYAYRNNSASFLNAIIPTVEVHVRTPLNHRDTNGMVFFQDQVNLTGGVHFRFGRATLSAAVNVPVVGPRPWNLEAMTFLNVYF